MFGKNKTYQVVISPDNIHKAVEKGLLKLHTNIPNEDEGGRLVDVIIDPNVEETPANDIRPAGRKMVGWFIPGRLAKKSESVTIELQLSTIEALYREVIMPNSKLK